MTDRFEDAVRDALHGLPSASGEIPTYHDAWQRGRRRRFIKRSALAAAGALVFLAALTVNLGRIPGSGTTEVDDVATGFEVATPVFEPTAVATTSPIETPDGASQAGSAAPSLQIPATPDDEPTPDATSVATDEPTATSAPVQQPAPTATAVPAQPAPTAPAPTSVPTTTPVPAAPTPVPQTGPDETAENDPTADSENSGLETELATESDVNDAAGTAQQPPDPGSPDESQPLPEPAFTSAAAADAVILAGAARGVAIPCDLDGDGVADANCELLVDYACTGDGDARPGYSAIDIDGDQLIDTCVAMDITVCDTTQDGVGDTPCIIELTAVQAEQSDDDG